MSVRGRLSLLPRCASYELPLTQISAKHCTLIPEPFTLNRETGIGKQGMGMGMDLGPSQEHDLHKAAK